MKKQYDNKDEKYTEFFVQVDDAQEFCYVTSIFEYYRLFDELSLFGNEFKGKEMYFFNPYLCKLLPDIQFLCLSGILLKA